MAIVASGQVEDRPFARTVVAVARKKFTGDLTLAHSGNKYIAAWENGKIVAAHSNAPADSEGRIALAAGLINSTQLGHAVRQATRDGRPSIEVLSEIGKLTPAHVESIRALAFAQRAMRIFAHPTGSFALETPSSLTAEPGVPTIDVRWLVYNGIRKHYSESRLRAELGMLADTAVEIDPQAIPAIAGFQFGTTESQCVQLLKEAPHTAEQLAHAANSSKELALAVVYALAVVGCLETVGGGAPSVRIPTNRPHTAKGAAASGRKATDSGSQDNPTKGSRTRGTAIRKSTQPNDSPPPQQVRKLVANTLRLVDAGSSHFEVLGVSNDATAAQISGAYFGLAKVLHPDRLRANGVTDINEDAHRLFAHINQAFAVISNPSQRAHYLEMLQAGGESKLREQQQQAEELALRIMNAEHEFQRGVLALRGNQFAAALAAFSKAVELNPDEGEHHAMLAWATWCTSKDKNEAHHGVSAMLSKAIAMSPKSVDAYYYRGLIAKQRNNLASAKDCFNQVLKLQPTHKQAALELRLLKNRDSPKKKGLFRR